ncbi:hypothetical protein [Geodermatophilus maliterrae]|uniref:Uncharacterized protein n=1 Tax=Geodermatophilus maliterrae TaxID=3162531 RepID=A0ABV3XJI2_9ACTN
MPAVPGIEAEVRQWRTDEAVGGQVQVTVTDTGAEPFTVTAVAIDSAGFAPLPDRQVDVAFTPGRTFDLPTQYGAAVCDRAAEPAAVRLTVVRPDGRSEQLLVPLAAEVLTRIHAEACAVQAVLAVVDVTVTGLALDGEAAVGSVVLTRAGDDDRPVEVARLGGNVLYDATADVPATLAAGESRLELPVEFTVASCDPHVLAEIKQPYVFPMAVRVGDDDQVPVDLPLDPPQREVLAALVDRVCG